MAAATWDTKRETLTTYFDRTAAGAWEALTSDAPVSRIRATVRAGRETMRELILSRLPAEMAGRTLLDAGCGTGALALAVGERGAAVTAIDVSPRMVEIARERATPSPFGSVTSIQTVRAEERLGLTKPRLEAPAGGNGPSRRHFDRLNASSGRTGGGSRSGFQEESTEVSWRVGDMLDPALGRFDHVVCMDSLIHYRQSDILAALAGLAARTERSIVFTIAPRTPLLAVMHRLGKLFPRADRAPAIEPVAPARLEAAIAADPRLAGWRIAWRERVTSGFYMSQALELVRP